jgi:hypothetical protein
MQSCRCHRIVATPLALAAALSGVRKPAEIKLPTAADIQEGCCAEAELMLADILPKSNCRRWPTSD